MTEKRPRRTRAELRDMMLAAGKDVLYEIEPSLGFEELTYSTVFDHLLKHYDQRVTIGSVHERIWKSQRDFQLDVVAEVLSGTITPTIDLALDRALEVIKSLDLSTPAGRRYAAQTTIRLNSQHLFVGPSEDALDVAHTVRFRLWALGQDHPEANGFTEAIAEIRQAATLAYADVARALMAAVGLRVRADAGDADEVIESIALLGNAVSIGLLTDVIDQARTTRCLPSGPSGEPEQWYPDAIALWSYVCTMLELDGEGLTADERRL